MPTQAFSFDNRILSFRTNSQYLCVVKPSVAKVIFLSSKASSLFLMKAEEVSIFVADIFAVSDTDGVNVSAIYLFERLAMYV
jgi:hypothetical protein